MNDRLIFLLRTALQQHATDLHFSVRDQELVIEMRCGQKMKLLESCPEDLNLFRYLEYLADLDISDHLRPQTGRFDLEVDGTVLALRFAVMQSLRVTSGVLRILNGRMDWLLKDLCRDRRQTELLKKALQQRSGLILISGPTGSGKTTTLYAMLNELKGLKIFTLEDPIEIYSEDYVQIQINERQHLSYDEGISQLLRHDPDVIMIGEVRDSTAAAMALRCALSGHLVLTSIHASSAVLALSRMKELGANGTDLMDTLVCVSNQRLVTLKNQKGKMCVYEVLQKSDLAVLRKDGCVPESFITLDERMEIGRAHV